MSNTPKVFTNAPPSQFSRQQTLPDNFPMLQRKPTLSFASPFQSTFRSPGSEASLSLLPDELSSLPKGYILNSARNPSTGNQKGGSRNNIGSSIDPRTMKEINDIIEASVKNSYKEREREITSAMSLKGDALEGGESPYVDKYAAQKEMGKRVRNLLEGKGIRETTREQGFEERIKGFRKLATFVDVSKLMQEAPVVNHEEKVPTPKKPNGNGFRKNKSLAIKGSRRMGRIATDIPQKTMTKFEDDEKAERGANSEHSLEEQRDKNGGFSNFFTEEEKSQMRENYVARKYMELKKSAIKMFGPEIFEKKNQIKNWGAIQQKNKVNYEEKIKKMRKERRELSDFGVSNQLIKYLSEPIRNTKVEYCLEDDQNNNNYKFEQYLKKQSHRHAEDYGFNLFLQSDEESEEENVVALDDSETEPTTQRDTTDVALLKRAILYKQSSMNIIKVMKSKISKIQRDSPIEKINTQPPLPESMSPRTPNTKRNYFKISPLKTSEIMPERLQEIPSMNASSQSHTPIPSYSIASPNLSPKKLPSIPASENSSPAFKKFPSKLSLENSPAYKNGRQLTVMTARVPFLTQTMSSGFKTASSTTQKDRSPKMTGYSAKTPASVGAKKSAEMVRRTEQLMDIVGNLNDLAMENNNLKRDLKMSFKEVGKSYKSYMKKIVGSDIPDSLLFTTDKMEENSGANTKLASTLAFKIASTHGEKQY